MERLMIIAEYDATITCKLQIEIEDVESNINNLDKIAEELAIESFKRRPPQEVEKVSLKRTSLKNY